VWLLLDDVIIKENHCAEGERYENQVWAIGGNENQGATDWSIAGVGATHASPLHSSLV